MATLLAVTAIMGAGVALVLGGLLVVRRVVTRPVFKPSDSAPGNALSVLGSLYGVLLAFVVVAVWGQYDDAVLDVEREVNELTDMFRLAASFGEPDGPQLRELILAYTRAVASEEWDTMRHGRPSERCHELTQQIWQAYGRIEPDTDRQRAAYSESLDSLDDFSDARKARLSASEHRLPPVMWYLLIGAGIVTLSFTYFFRLEDVWSHIFMTAALAAVVGAVLLLIYAFDSPFTGIIRVGPDSFERLSIEFQADLGK